jgi:hypothetical protein
VLERALQRAVVGDVDVVRDLLGVVDAAHTVNLKKKGSEQISRNARALASHNRKIVLTPFPGRQTRSQSYLAFAPVP